MSPPVHVEPDSVIEMIDGHMRRRVMRELAAERAQRDGAELAREAFHRGGLVAQRRRRATSRGARI